MAGQIPVYSGGKSLYLGWQWQKWMSIDILWQFFSTIFKGLKKNYHYSEKAFSTKRQKIFIGLKNFCQAYEKSI